MKIEFNKIIKTNEKGGYTVRKQFGGKRYLRSFKTKSEAEQRKTNGIIVDKESMTLNALFLEYMDCKSCKKGTVKKYDQLFRLHFKELQQIKLSDINTVLLKKWLKNFNDYTIVRRRNYLTKTYTETTEKSTLKWRCVTVMRELLKYAVENKYMLPISSSWTQGVKHPKTSSDKIQAKTMGYTDTLKLIDFLKNKTFIKSSYKFYDNIKTWTSDNLAFVCSVLLYTGVRFGELRALKVKDFHLGVFCGKECYICEVSKQMDDDDEIVPLKNSDTAEGFKRIVPLTAEVYKSFKEFFERNNYNDDQYILDFNNTGCVPRRNSFPRALNKYITIAKEMGVLSNSCSDDLSNHSFRRTNTKYFYKILGLPFEITAKIQGHAKEVMFQSYLMIDQEEQNLNVFSL